MNARIAGIHSKKVSGREIVWNIALLTTIEDSHVTLCGAFPLDNRGHLDLS